MSAIYKSNDSVIIVKMCVWFRSVVCILWRQLLLLFWMVNFYSVIFFFISLIFIRRIHRERYRCCCTERLCLIRANAQWLTALHLLFLSLTPPQRGSSVIFCEQVDAKYLYGVLWPQYIWFFPTLLIRERIHLSMSVSLVEARRKSTFESFSVNKQLDIFEKRRAKSNCIQAVFTIFSAVSYRSQQ